jgi:hypothetical protein
VQTLILEDVSQLKLVSFSLYLLRHICPDQLCLHHQGLRFMWVPMLETEAVSKTSEYYYMMTVFWVITTAARWSSGTNSSSP